MAILSDADRERVREMLAGMVNPVRLVFFTQTLDCDSCLPTKQILDALVPLNEKLSLEELNFLLDKDQVGSFGVDRVPAIAVVGAEDTGIRFYGAPAGYEFMALIDAILAVSTGATDLSEETLARLEQIAEPVRIQVFTTPT